MNGVSDLSLNARTSLRIGFLDENGNDEYHGMLLEGVEEAARQHGASVVRIGHFMSNDTSRDARQITALLQYARQYQLDGLLYLGWGRVASYENEAEFLEAFRGLPLFSIGVSKEDIPSAKFDGEPYVEELLHHLSLEHGYRKIAFIAPFNPDGRSAVYHRVMRQRGLTDPALYVEAERLEGLTVPERGRRAVEILLDERGQLPEAVMSLYNVETEAILKELAERGIRVPDDMAVTSYEDGELGRYETPAYTTILYPWRELGRISCDLFLTRLARQKHRKESGPSALFGPSAGLAAVMGLSANRQGALPMQILVPGQVLYRESCGCTQELKATGRAAATQGKSLLELTEQEFQSLAEAVTSQIKGVVKVRIPDFQSLLMGFRRGLQTGNRRLFLSAVEAQMEFFSGTETFRGSGPLLDLFRNAILAHVDKTPAMLLAAEDMFMQADALLAERELRFWGERERKLKARNRSAEDAGQAIIAQYTLAGLSDVLEQGLTTLGIPSCLLVLYDRLAHAHNPFGACTPVVRFVNGKSILEGPSGNHTAKTLIADFLAEPGQSACTVSNLLGVGNEISGFIVYGTGPLDERIYSALSSHISTALAGIFLTERLEQSFQRLVSLAHKEGMSHAASGVLHNIRNVLGSMTTTAQRMQEVLAQAPVADLQRAMTLFEEQRDPVRFLLEDPRAEKLLLLLRHLESPLRTYDEAIGTLAERLLDKNRNIRELLTAQQGTGRDALKLEICDAVSMMEEALVLGTALSEESSVLIERVYADSFSVHAHQNGLLHALVNLIRNACEAMSEIPSAGRRLSVELQCDEASGVFRIRDTGPGLSEAQLETLFLLGHTTKAGGHGIGLHVSANDISAMGGEIRATSDGPGRGACFEIRLPLAGA